MGTRWCLVVVACALPFLVGACGDDPNGLNGRGSASSSGGSSSGSSGDTSSSSSGDTSSSSGATPPPPPASDGSDAQMCVDTINAYRKTAGLPPFARWTDEESCADGEAASDGATKVAHGDAFKCQELSQNECPGDSPSGQVYYPAPASQSIPKCLELMWSQPPGEGHHDNMASTKWTKVACGFATLSNGAVWSVQNFR